jgi:voltage-gated potassium channel
MSAIKRLQLVLLAVLALNAIGTIGYKLIEGWPWMDCLFMTFITLATIGFGEVHPLSSAGRIFTMLLFWPTAGLLAFAISTGTQVLIQLELVKLIGGKRKMFKDIGRLKDHYIVCGAGRVGRQVIKEMQRRGVDFVVIESDEGKGHKLLEHGLLVLIGDATDEETLRGAGLTKARAVVCTLPTDADNVYTTITARGLNPLLYIVARASEEAAVSKLMKAGANRVISPVLIGGHRIAQAALSPAVSEFIELTTAEDLDLWMEQVEIEAGSPLIGKKLRDTQIRSELDTVIIAIKRSSGEMHFNPSGDAEILSGDMFIAVGSEANLRKLANLANPKATVRSK